MDLLALRYFAAVADRGSLSAAARSLGLTQPGLTKAVRRLENELGCALLVRLPRGIGLTAEGEALLRHARLIEAQTRDAVEDVLARATGRVGRLRIGAGPSWLTQILPDAVTELTRRSPGLTFEVLGGFNADLLGSLREGGLDAVVSALPDRLPHGLSARPLTMDTLRLVSRRGHPLAQGRGSLRLHDLAGQQWALPGQEVLSRQRLEALFRAGGFAPPEPVVESDSLPFITAVVKGSDMLSFATARLLASDMAGLAALDCPELTLDRVAGVITRAGSPSTRAMEAFLNAMTARTQELVSN
jgi:DNA-binding transcriptional LysR family regulator